MRFLSSVIVAALLWSFAATGKVEAQGSWTPFGSVGASDVAVTPSGVVWLVARNASGGSALYIGEKEFTGPGGTPSRVAADLDGFPWVLNSDGTLWHYVRTGPGKEEWQQTSIKAIDIAVGADGSVWAVDSANSVLRIKTDGVQSLGGSASRIAVDPSGNPWIVDAAGQVMRWMDGAWKPVGGKASDISIAPDSTVFILGATPVAGGFEIQRLKGSEWERISGGAGIAIAAGSKALFVTQDATTNRVLSSDNAALAVVPSAPAVGPLEAILAGGKPAGDATPSSGSPVATANPAQAAQPPEQPAAAPRADKPPPIEDSGPTNPPPAAIVPVPGKLACTGSLAECVAKGGDGLVWQLGQYPEPGTYRFMPGLLPAVLSDPAALDSFLNVRANGDTALKRQMWTKMISDPAGSAELKALIFASLLEAASDENPSALAKQSLGEFESYIRSRRFYVAQEALRIYRKSHEVDSVYATLPPGTAVSARAVTDAKGLPLSDFKSFAWSATLPDSAGMEFISAYAQLSQPADVTLTAPNLVSSAMKASKGVFGLTDKTQMASDYTKYLEQLSFPVSVKEMVRSNSPEEKQSLVLYWALATSAHYPVQQVGEGLMTGVEVCASGPWSLTQCAAAKKMVRAAAKAAGYTN